MVVIPNLIDQRRVDVLCDHDQKVPTKDFCPSVTHSLRHITDTKNPCVLVLTRCRMLARA